MIDAECVRVVKEKMEFASQFQGSDPKTYWRDHGLSFVINLHRNLRDNSFSISRTELANGVEKPWESYKWNLWIANKIVKPKANYKDKFTEEELHNHSMTTFGIIGGNIPSLKTSFASIMIYHKNMTKSDLFIKPGEILDLQSINKISFNYYYDHVIIKYYYNHILIKSLFKKRVWKKIYAVSIYNDGEKNHDKKTNWSSIDKDVIYHKGEITNLKIEGTKKMGVRFEKTHQTNDTILGHAVNGYISIMGLTHYDYKTQKTIFGYGPGGIEGYQVPLSFKGHLTPRLKINFNEAFKDLNLSTDLIYKNKILDPYDGDIKLQIHKKSKTEGKLFWSATFDLSHLSKIVDLDKPNLTSLKRASIEKDF